MDRNDDSTGWSRSTRPAPRLGWWLGQVVLTAIAGFFTVFGISLLLASYRLKDPFSFVMTFFAASLIILISLVMLLGFGLRLWREGPGRKNNPDPEKDDGQT